MDVILGATGHVGSVVAKTLLQTGDDVLILTRDPKKKEEWERLGAYADTVDVFKTAELRNSFKKGSRLFLLNPPADRSTNTVEVEKQSIQSIFAAIQGLEFKKIVAESTYGAQAGDGLGDLGVLFEMEEKLRSLNLPHSFIRAAYYMSNWDYSIDSARSEGKIYSLYPAEFKIPMVAPKDIGEKAAQLLKDDTSNSNITYVEGPEMYSSQNVADALADLLKRKVEVVSIPQNQWVTTLESMGFSHEAASSMARMTQITFEEAYEKPTRPYRGKTTLKEYLAETLTKSLQ